MTPAAAKGEKLFLLAAAVLAAAVALLAPASAEASRYLPQALEPVTAPQASLGDLAGADDQPALPALSAADRLDLVDLAAGARLEAQQLGLHLASGELGAARKTASAGQTWAPEDNVRPISEMGVKTRRPTFQGLWTDPVTGLSYARARWYDPRNASWLSEDPLLDVDSPNLYAFVGWGPHVGADPLGLVAGIHSETGSPADYFGSLDLESGFAPLDYTALNLVNSVVNTVGKAGNLALNLAYCAGQVEEAARDLMIDQFGFTEADVSFLEVYFAAEPTAGRQLSEAGARAIAKLRQLAAARGRRGSFEGLREVWRSLRGTTLSGEGGGLRVSTGIRAGSATGGAEAGGVPTRVLRTQPSGWESVPVAPTSEVQSALRAGGLTDADWAYAIHRHHIYPRWLQGAEEGEVLHQRGLHHISELEPELFDFVKTQIPAISQKSGRQVQVLLERGIVSQDEITEALFQFYQQKFPTVSPEAIRGTLQKALGR